MKSFRITFVQFFFSLASFAKKKNNVKKCIILLLGPNVNTQMRYQEL